ncbi:MULTISPECIES: hypothetical protein [unclassified Mycolicibacterium]|uniref:hypothetical protein n=1 Tax=unclassified Mycolicibacterium TaxID=2636767 RepID=UPI002ED8F9A9
MDIGLGPLIGIIGRLPVLIDALGGSPLRIEVLEGDQRQQVIREAQIPARVIPRWVPGDPDTPPSTASFDALNLHRSIEEVAREQHWLPVDRDRIVLHIYNKSSNAVFVRDIRATAKTVPAQRLPQGCVIELGAGGGIVETFRLGVDLHSDRPCQVEFLGGPEGTRLTSRSYQLLPRQSLHLIVDAGVGLGETARVLDWCLWFELDVNRGIRARRRVRAPNKHAYFVGPRRSFRIVRRADAALYRTESNSDGFTWRRSSFTPPFNPGARSQMP